MTIWWLATSKNEGHCSYDELKDRKVLAQGWPALGDLSDLLPISDKHVFIETINKRVKDAYSGWEDERNPGRIIFNLFKFKENDLILCTEGETVKGIAKVGSNPKYRYDNKYKYEYEYAQAIYPVNEWKDWDVDLAGNPPYTKARGPVGINLYKGDEHIVLDAWKILPLST